VLSRPGALNLNRQLHQNAGRCQQRRVFIQLSVRLTLQPHLEACGAKVVLHPGEAQLVGTARAAMCLPRVSRRNTSLLTFHRVLELHGGTALRVPDRKHTGWQQSFGP